MVTHAPGVVMSDSIYLFMNISSMRVNKVHEV